MNQTNHKAHRETGARLMAHGGWFTNGCCLEVGCQEDRHEAEEGSQTRGVPAIALAVLVEDVDLGWFKVEAGVDLNHGAGPGNKRQVSRGRAGVLTACLGPWGKGIAPDESGLCKNPLEGVVWWKGQREFRKLQD